MIVLLRVATSHILLDGPAWAGANGTIAQAPINLDQGWLFPVTVLNCDWKKAPLPNAIVPRSPNGFCAFAGWQARGR
ncbi:MAG: hypothetical protein JXA89_21595 [Anaerolineae bacterium]|nr:hypothetical protein [Anaerolineae bacterium]